MRKRQSRRFAGVGTVFVSDIISVAGLAEQLGALDLIGVIKRHINHVTDIVEKHEGSILQFEGDAVLAFWHPHHTKPNHAQLAFDASREILSTLPDFVASQKRVTYDVDIVLGTGDMVGDFFGPGKRFQVVGLANAVADRLKEVGHCRISCIRMSQYTFDLIHSVEGIEETGVISRDGLEELKVFTYCSANMTTDRPEM